MTKDLTNNFISVIIYIEVKGKRKEKKMKIDKRRKNIIW